MNKKDIIQSSKIIILGLLFGLGVGYVGAVWQSPSGTPPAGNTSAPINVGTAQQDKAGSLRVQGFRSFGPAFLDDISVVARTSLNPNAALRIGTDNYPAQNSAPFWSSTENALLQIPPVVGRLTSAHFGGLIRGDTDLQLRGRIGVGSGVGALSSEALQVGGSARITNGILSNLSNVFSENSNTSVIIGSSGVYKTYGVSSIPAIDPYGATVNSSGVPAPGQVSCAYSLKYGWADYNFDGKIQSSDGTNGECVYLTGGFLNQTPKLNVFGGATIFGTNQNAVNLSVGGKIQSSGIGGNTNPNTPLCADTVGVIHTCPSNPPSSPPTTKIYGAFGGNYSINGSTSDCDFPNPLTSSCSCPSGYTAYTISRTQRIDSFGAVVPGGGVAVGNSYPVLLKGCY